MSVNPTDKAYEAVYAKCLNAICDQTFALQHSHLEYYWVIGQLVCEFIEAAGDEHSRKGLEQLAHDLETKMPHMSFGVTTLYCARSINRTYTKAQLSDKVAKGVMIGHLKALVSLNSEDERETITDTHLYSGPDGKAIPVKELETIIQQHKQQAAKKASYEAIEQAKRPAFEVSQPGNSEPVQDDTSSGDETKQDEGTTPEGPAPIAEGARSSGASAGGDVSGRGLEAHSAQGTGEFTNSPLKVLKAAESTATKLTIQAGDVVIAVTEASKIGFDSDRAQKNYDSAFINARTALVDLKGILDEVLRAMDESNPQ